MSNWISRFAWLYVNYDPVMLRALPFALVPVLLVMISFRDSAPRLALAATAGEAPYRFLMICSDCGRRERLVQAPTRVFTQVGQAFECPACGEPTLIAYRRGGQAMPPGGW